MNLGETYIQAFFYIAKLALLAAVVCVALLRICKRVHFARLFGITLLLWACFAYTGNRLFHRDLFVDWQKSQNKLVPQAGCLTYEPSFGFLYATYSMTRDEFDAWVAGYPRPLTAYDSSLQDHDQKRFGFLDPDIALATEMAPNGNQLRVYFKDDVMYLSYNVM